MANRRDRVAAPPTRGIRIRWARWYDAMNRIHFLGRERKATERGLDIHYRVGLIEEIPLPDGVFDVVLSSLMLHHLPKEVKRRGIAEIARVLKRGGRFVAVDIDPPLVGNLRTVAEAMQANGFTELSRGKTGFRTLFIPIHYLSGTAG